MTAVIGVNVFRRRTVFWNILRSEHVRGIETQRIVVQTKKWCCVQYEQRVETRKKRRIMNHGTTGSGVWDKVEYSTLGYGTDDGGQGTWK